MRRSYWAVLLTLILALMSAASIVQADDRINVIDHFGGDALYCNQSDGCFALDAEGQQLWAVSQEAIDAAAQAACDTGVPQHIDVGDGTYGPMVMVITCPDQIDFGGWDEWDKFHFMHFTTDYLPVNAPAAVEPACVLYNGLNSLGILGKPPCFPG